MILTDLYRLFLQQPYEGDVIFNYLQGIDKETGAQSSESCCSQWCTAECLGWGSNPDSAAPEQRTL